MDTELKKKVKIKKIRIFINFVTKRQIYSKIYISKGYKCFKDLLTTLFTVFILYE